MACCLLPALLSFSFLRHLLPVGCRFFTVFCLASFRGMGEWVVKPRIFDLLRVSGCILYPPDFLCTCIYGLSGWACVMVSPFPYIVEDALFLRGSVRLRWAETPGFPSKIRLPRNTNTIPFLCPGNYRPSKVVQGNTITLARSNEPYMQQYEKNRVNLDSKN